MKKYLVFFLFPLFLQPCFSQGGVSLGDKTTTVIVEEVDSLTILITQLLGSIENLASQGVEIPERARALITKVRAEISSADPPADKETVDYWVALVERLGGMLLAGILSIWGLAEGLGVTKDGLLAKWAPRLKEIKKRWLVIAAAVIVTVLSVTLFRAEGAWTLIEAGAYLLTTLFGAVRLNREAVAVGLKDK